MLWTSLSKICYIVGPVLRIEWYELQPSSTCSKVSKCKRSEVPLRPNGNPSAACQTSAANADESPQRTDWFSFLGRSFRGTLEDSRLRRLHNLPFREDILQSSWQRINGQPVPCDMIHRPSTEFNQITEDIYRCNNYAVVNGWYVENSFSSEIVDIFFFYRRTV